MIDKEKIGTLAMEPMEEDFFYDSAFIGIGSSLPSYRLCALLNQALGLVLGRRAEYDICMKKKGKEDLFFPLYGYDMPLNGAKHIFYQLKSENGRLLPELKQLDFLWKIQSTTPDQDAEYFVQLLRNINEVQLAQIIEPTSMKNIKNLLL